MTPRAPLGRIFSPREPKAAERIIAWLGDMAGAVVQTVDDDQNGWDCLVEFPPIDAGDMPPDLAPPGLSLFIQVKSSKTAKRSVRISLSNALKYARHALPYFIVLVTTERGPDTPTIYVKHVWPPLIEEMLKAVRKAHIDGRPLHKAGITIRFESSERHDLDAMRHIATVLDGLGPDYATRKEALVAATGYDEGYARGTITFDEMDTPRFVDMMLGLEPALDVKRITLHAMRFGLLDPIPELDGEGQITIEPRPSSDCKVTFRDPVSGKEVTFDGELFAPGIPNLPREYWKLRVKTDLTDLAFVPGQLSSLTATLDMDEALPLDRLYRIVAFRSWSTGGRLEMQIWARDRLLTTTDIAMNSDEDGSYWRRMERVLEALLALSPAEKRPQSLRFSLRQLFEQLSMLEEFREVLEGETLSLDGDLTAPAEVPPGEMRLSLPCWLEFEGFLFFAINSRPVRSMTPEGAKTKIITGPPKRSIGAILKGSQADHQSYIDAETRRAHGV
ncbi:hypothetical protein BZG35_02365 [Brevundimonas sp. LM2]|nr:hypothetical protein [Brevundimonas sp. LM2]AQR60619.1 hypothetical protein BZG35_02365 [Brevundimonas sp. LM2]